MKPVFTPQQKKVIFFDLNNTLIDRKETMHQAFLAALRQFTGRWSQDEFAGGSERAWKRYYDGLTGKRRARKKSVSKIALRQSSLRHALSSLPIQVNDPFVKAFLHELKKVQLEHPLSFPETQKTIKALAKSYRIGIISNGEKEHIVSQIRLLGLDGEIHTDHIFHSSAQFRKPHPSLYRHAATSTNVRPGEAVMVGDNWKTDILGSTQCGMDAIWISPDHAKKTAIRKIGNERIIVIRKISFLLPLFSP